LWSLSPALLNNSSCKSTNFVCKVLIIFWVESVEYKVDLEEEGEVEVEDLGVGICWASYAFVNCTSRSLIFSSSSLTFSSMFCSNLSEE